MKSKTKGINESVIILAIRVFGMLTMLAMFLAVSLLSGCQDEKMEIKQPSADAVITVNSPLADLVGRVTLKDGSSDNILDSSSCTSFALPLVVVANGIEMTLHTEEDLDEIENIFDDSENNDLKIVFPVTVVLSDHTRLTINSEDELEDLLDECTEDSDDDIECIDFQYPVSLSLYNSETQAQDVITIADDEAMNRFFLQLKSEVLVSISYPVVLVLYNGEQVTVSDNEELEKIIEEVADACDEDDDSGEDHEHDTEIIDILTQGAWEITYFFDESLQTTLFNGFTLTFNADGSVVAGNGVLTVNGSWTAYIHNEQTLLDLNFESGTIFHDIDEEWIVTERSATRLVLEDSSGSDGTKLVIEKK